MASELQVTTLKGNPTGANANQILVPSGQTLHAPGHVVQTVTYAFTDVSTITTYGTTYTDVTGATITITPKHSNSKILIMPNIVFYMSISGTYVYGGFRLLRGSSTVIAPTNSMDGNGSYDYGTGFPSSGAIQLSSRHCGHHIDTPATTSATTYKFQGINYASGRTFRINNAGGSSSIVAMEIAQ
jgi:hypothetical protein